MTGEKVAGLIVIYNPCYKNLEDLANILIKEISQVFIVNNGISDVIYQKKKKLLEEKGVKFIEMNGNAGIAKALNCGVATINSEGYAYCWLFDQDSLPERGGLGILLRIFQSQLSGSAPLAAVVPSIMDLHGKKMLPMLVGTKDGKVMEKMITLKQEVSAAITSGMLVDINVWLQTKGAKEEYFIDFVDTEWCFRAKSKGYQIICEPGTFLHHRLGDVGPEFSNFNGRAIRQRPAMRTYHFVRNGLLLSAESYVPNNWAAYVFQKIVKVCAIGIILGPNRFEQFRAIVQAIKYVIKVKLKP